MLTMRSGARKRRTGPGQAACPLGIWATLYGTGAAGLVADVGVRDGRIVAIGGITEEAAETVDATGLVVCPGFVDPHTHYDAQLFWDKHATPSNLFGVTSMVAGNCGFGLAPLGDEADGEYLKKMMVKVLELLLKKMMVMVLVMVLKFLVDLLELWLHLLLPHRTKLKLMK